MKFILEIFQFLQSSQSFTFITTLTALFSAGVAFFSARAARRSAYIADQQHQLQSVMTQHALYERRLAVFRGVIDFVESVNVIDDNESEEGKIFRREYLLKFKSATAESYFIFEEDIQQYIHKLRSKESKLNAVSRRLKSSNGNDEDLKEQRDKLLTYFSNQVLKAIENFYPYLKIDLPNKRERTTLYYPYKVSLGTEEARGLARVISLVFRRLHVRRLHHPTDWHTLRNSVSHSLCVGWEARRQSN